jgi:subtilisin
LAPGEALLFVQLGAVLTRADPDQARSLTRSARRRGLLVAPERYVRASEVRVESGATACLPQSLADSALAAWGLQATRTLSSRASGRGVRVAILDTGLDFGHPDFVGRAVVPHSFMEGLPANDANGHGTFCAGVACGSRRPSDAPRYGIADGAELYIARVLDDNAEGMDGDVIAGIDWAVRHHCAVASLCLGSTVGAGAAYPQVYEQVAARALAAGTLLIAPSGNTSQRPETIEPVEHPANCPSIVAVAALDQSCAVAPFSNGDLDDHGGNVDVAAPGIAILSAAPRPTLYQTASGTSMAAACVAGIAALLAEAGPEVRGAALRTRLLQGFMRLPARSQDVGVGLVQAPQ